MVRKPRADLASRIQRFAPGERFNLSPVPGVYCVKVSHPNNLRKSYWRASLSIIVQGCKELSLDGDVYRADDCHYIAAPVALPVSSRISSVSPARPFLCLLIEFDPVVVSEVVASLEGKFPKEIGISQRAVFTGKASDKMLDAATRLGELFDTPDDAPVLGALVIKEIIYHLLNGPNGPSIRQFVRSGSKTHQIAQAIYRINSELSAEMDVSVLAGSVNMSRSAFFQCFKEVTSMSPIQYQKRLRLLEARRLMTESGETAQISAFRVGYKSASQFSREYSRMFGESPLRNAMKVKAAGAPVDEGKPG